MFTPTVGGLVGYTDFDGASDQFDYTYWNAGLALAVDNLTFDFRYWDTDADAAIVLRCACKHLRRAVRVQCDAVAALSRRPTDFTHRGRAKCSAPFFVTLPNLCAANVL